MPAMPGVTIAPSFRGAVEGHDLEALGATSSTVVGVDSDLRIALYNEAYVRFAEQNGGGPAFLRSWGLGASLLDAIPPVLSDFYRSRLLAAMASNEPWQHTYECSSPDLERTLHLTAYPLGGRGLLLVHSVRLEVPHTRELAADPVDSYRDGNGFLTQCAYCRRTRRSEARWDFVPAALARGLDNVSHGICRACADHYFAE